jgi:hypothetical protein
MNVHIANAKRLIIVMKLFLLLIKKIIHIIKNTICASKKGIVSSSLKTSTKTKSIL